jgi:intracellular sulfur oxidation DsrE/DsrF family protein
MNPLKLFLAAFAVTAATSVAAAPAEPIKVVYHVTDGLEKAPQLIRNLRNHRNADSSAKIVVVTHALGVDFLMRDAKDANGNPFEVAVQDLVSKGVEFRVCEFTLKSRNIDKKQMIDEVKYVPSGIVEVARLQAQEHYSYLKP